MAAKKVPESTVRFETVFPAGDTKAAPLHVTGAAGGMTTAGELVISFHFDRMSLPQSVTHELNAQGRLGEQVARQPAPDKVPVIVRHVQSSIVVSLQNAVELQRWLGTVIQSALIPAQQPERIQ